MSEENKEKKTDSKSESQPVAKFKQDNKSKGKIAIVLVRGLIGVNFQIKDTCTMLNLYKKNYCSIYDDTPSVRGMIRKIKDYATYGILDDETAKLLSDKKSKKDPKTGKTVNYYNLAPPQKGFGRKGIKQPFNVGGALGDRKEKINDLIKRMIH